jgi:hypothetical protein
MQAKLPEGARYSFTCQTKAKKQLCGAKLIQASKIAKKAKKAKASK